MSASTNLNQDLIQALKNAGLLENFQTLPPSHQNEYLKWVNEAKRSETRAKRIAQMLNMLSK